MASKTSAEQQMDKLIPSPFETKEIKLWSRRRRKHTRTGTLVIWPSSQDDAEIEPNEEKRHHSSQLPKTSSRDGSQSANTSVSTSPNATTASTTNSDHTKYDTGKSPKSSGKSPQPLGKGIPLVSRNPNAQYTKPYPPRHSCSISHPEVKKPDEDMKPEQQQKRPQHLPIKLLAAEDGRSRYNLPCVRQCFIWIFLIPLWIFFTIMLMLVVKGKETEKIFRNTDIIQDKLKVYPLGGSSESLTVKFEFLGPFETALTQTSQKYTFDDFPDRILVLWLQRWYASKDIKGSVKPADVDLKEDYRNERWHLLMRYAPNHTYDLHKGTYRTLNLYIPPTNLTKGTEEDKEKIKGKRRIYVLVIQKYKYNESYPTVPMAVRFSLHDADLATAVIVAVSMLLLLHFLFVLEILINRTLSAVISATTYLGVVIALIEERPTFLDIIKWLKIDVLILVFSIMLIVTTAADTGLYDVIALNLYQMTRGHVGWLFLFICSTTSIVCLILNNVITVMVMTPIVIRSFEIFNLDPVPILIAMTMLSNVAGAATFPGSYPTSLIGRDEWVEKNEVTSLQMFSKLIFGLCLIALQTGIFFWLFFLFYKAHRLRTTLIVHDLNQQTKLWRRLCEGIPDVSEHNYEIKEKMDDYAEDLEKEQRKREGKDKTDKTNCFGNLIQALKSKSKKKNDADVEKKSRNDNQKTDITKGSPIIKKETEMPTKYTKEKPLQIHSPVVTPNVSPQISSHEERSPDITQPTKSTDGKADKKVNKDDKENKDTPTDKIKDEVKPIVRNKDEETATVEKKDAGTSTNGKKAFKNKLYKILGIDTVDSKKYKASVEDRIEELRRKNVITNWCLLIKVAVAVIVALTLLISPFKNITNEWGVLLAALLLLLMMDRGELEHLLLKIEWSTLILLAALFVFNEVQVMVGFPDYIKTLIENGIQAKNEESRLNFAGFLYTWVIAIAAALCNNIGVADSALQAVLASAANVEMKLQLLPLLWAYVFGICLGGNLTLIGAGPNIVCAGMAEQQGYHITYLRYLKYGLCVGIVNILLANLILWILC